MSSNNPAKLPGTDILGSVMNVFKGVTSGVKNTANKVFNSANSVQPKRNSTNKLKFSNSPGGQTGGTAPLNYSYSPGQPSDKVMEWATTAGIPPHKGGKRRTHKGGKRVKRRTLKRSHKRGHKRSHKHNK